MSSSPPDTRTRLLDAATAEFAEFGLAGGRVDRIAGNARANKQLIYAYYDSKVGLFETVLATRIAGLLSVVPFDAQDVPGYAERLFDFYVANASLLRLATWSEVERPGALDAVPEARVAAAEKVEALREVVAAGLVTDEVDPAELVQAVLDLTASAARRAIEATSGATEPDGTDANRAQPAKVISAVASEALRRQARSVLRVLVERLVRPEPLQAGPRNSPNPDLT